MNVEKIFEKLDLYFHNKGIALKVKEAYERGEDVVSIIQATGTGKTLIALFVTMLYPDKDTLYVVPSNAIKEHVYEVIDDLGLDLEKDFPKLNIVTYQSFIRMSRKEIENIPCELLICDEIHHLGAPVWKDRMETLKETHEGMKVFGMSAYTVRRRGTAYEMDVTDAYTNELFSGSVVSVYDMYDAIIDGVLPKFNYKTTVVEDMEEIVELEKELERIIDKSSDYYKKCERLVLDFKKMIHKSDGVKELIKKTIDMGDKCIYFCPVNSSLGNNDIDSIMEEVKETLKEIYNEEDIVFYKTTSEDGEKGKYNRECFYNDVDLNGKDSSNKIRIMFAKNQYNEGVHAPGVNKVLLGRMTRSDIVYFEQIGRCLAACRDIRKLMLKYEGYTLEELQREVKRKEFDVSDYNDRDVLIEVLVAPMVVDLSGNILFIEEMENNLKTRVEEVRESNKTGKKRNINIKNVSFNIDVVNKEMMSILYDLRERLVDSNWNNYYELAKKYYEHHGDSEIVHSFKTKNGIVFDESEGCINLGRWIEHQRAGYDKLSEDKKIRLELIKFRIERNKFDLEWEKNYELAKKYYEHYGNSEIKYDFKTKNGIDLDESEGCINLGSWIETQRNGYDKLSDERREKLALIKFRTERNKRDLDWEKNYKLAKKYYERYGDSEIKKYFKTKNGIAYDDSPGCINLGRWIENQRVRYDKLSEDKKIKLDLIEFKVFIKKHRNIMIELCEKYGIDYKKYEFLVKNMSYQELVSKINYLNDIGAKLVIDGEINPLFKMSSENMMELIGFSKQELIKEYYVNKKGKV